MATIDITENMIPSGYGEADRWITADQFSLAIPATTRPTDPDWAAAWVELEMKCRYTGITRFSVLYQGPGGTMRTEYGAPEENGPIGSLVAQASVISSTPQRRPKLVHVQAGDVLVINNQRMVIVDDDPHRYPTLVTELEAGIRAAASYVRERLIQEVQPYAETAGKTDDQIDREVELERVKWQTRMAVLAEVFSDIKALAPVLREQYAAPAKR
jgi:hypothetical protein